MSGIPVEMGTKGMEKNISYNFATFKNKLTTNNMLRPLY